MFLIFYVVVSMDIHDVLKTNGISILGDQKLLLRYLLSVILLR